MHKSLERRGALVTCLLLPVIAFSIFGCGSGSSNTGSVTPPPSGATRLLYVSNDSKGPRILSIPATGGLSTAVTARINGTDFAVSPDHTQIAYISDRQIYTVSVKGATPVKRTNSTYGVTSFFWSPNSKLLAYTDNDTSSMTQLSVTGLNQGAVKLTTDNTNKAISSGVWSPDSQRLVYATSNNRLYTIPTARGTPTQLVNSIDGVGSAAWSPDGKTIAFVGDQPLDGDGNPEIGFRAQIWTIPATGGTSKMWTRSFSRGKTRLVWSPNSSLIAYTQYDGFDPSLSVLSLATGQVKTARGFILDTPLWFPDSEHLAFLGDGEVIARFAVSSAGTAGFTDIPPAQESPALSPDNQTLAFSGRDDSGSTTPRQVWTIPIGSAVVKPMTSGSTDNAFIGWGIIN